MNIEFDRTCDTIGLRLQILGMQILGMQILTGEQACR